MGYSVRELKEKLDDKISSLGIDSRFKENPAYDSALKNIWNLISQMNMFEDAETVMVSETDRQISFNWISSDGAKYSISIFSVRPETFRCIMVEERKPFIGTNGQIIRVKNAIEEVATIDKLGFVTLTTNGAMADNIDCGNEKCNHSTWAERKYYTSEGVMGEREHKTFSRVELPKNFDMVGSDLLLAIPRGAFQSDIFSKRYESRTILVRNKLDTARIYSEDKAKGIRYSAITPLNQEHGLGDMVLPSGYSYPQNVVITPLSQEAIYEMIQRESNPKVAEGLRRYAVGRDNYFYNSEEDINFVREGISLGISK